MTTPMSTPRILEVRTKILKRNDELARELEHDADSTLYWLIQCAAASSVGYSSSHALVCASLCHVVAPVVGLDAAQQRSLDRKSTRLNSSHVSESRMPSSA